MSIGPGPQRGSSGSGRHRRVPPESRHPPTDTAMSNALELLLHIGAIQPDEHLTSLGKCLATLPVEPTIGESPHLRHPSPALLCAYDGWKEAEMRGQGRDFAWRNFWSGPTSQALRASSSLFPWQGRGSRGWRLLKTDAALTVVESCGPCVWTKRRGKNCGRGGGRRREKGKEGGRRRESSPAGNSSSQVISLKALETRLILPITAKISGDGRFSFRQIDLVLEALKAQGKRAFLTIPVKYTSRKIRDHVLREEGGRGEGRARARRRGDRNASALDGGRDCLPAFLEGRGWTIVYWSVCHGAARSTVGRTGGVEEGGRRINALLHAFSKGEVPDNPEPSHIFPPSSKQGPSLLPSSLPSPPMIAISNDCMRDHWLDLLEARPFLRWKTTQVSSSFSLPCSFFHFPGMLVSVFLTIGIFECDL
ncbi:hypothetical protein NSK_000777 [Nannochloropsis salina CCMP1776]|uniref:Helicase associated domain-containing protein n=1 Tax=Nannochloropsis salina CCMP1776 TaxID=1027361 RepID=A0A4D9DAD9_9STRA|nr:hypothetical protein NSK_000777 [Nannochloropsis salina CCMP1776]|eukprot:TFJ87974.1 hypothetical protein NSK_000777 [Nannochloropsis salina CCMP1776]